MTLNNSFKIFISIEIQTLMFCKKLCLQLNQIAQNKIITLVKNQKEIFVKKINIILNRRYLDKTKVAIC